MKPADVLAMLDREIADDAARLERKRTARHALAAAYGDDVLEDVVTERLSGAVRKPKAAAAPAGGKIADRHEAIDARVLKACASKPIAPVALARALQLSRLHVHASLKRLTAAKQLVSRGRMRAARYGTPDVMAAASAQEGD